MTLFSAPNYCGEFDNAGAMMSVDETLMCSFQVNYSSLNNPSIFEVYSHNFCASLFVFHGSFGTAYDALNYQSDGRNDALNYQSDDCNNALFL